jgi:ribonuclease P protein component
MLAKIYSLKGKRKIDEVLKKGKKKQSDNFGVFHLDRKTSDLPKFVFVISKKISKLAVNRNRVKRAMSESVRRNIKIVPKGMEFVFLAKKSIVKRSTEEIMKEVFDFLKTLKEK